MASFDKNDTQEKVIQLIMSELKVDKDAIKLTTSFEDLGVDSLDMVQIIMKCEELFGLEIPDDIAEKFHTVTNVIDYIAAHRTK